MKCSFDEGARLKSVHHQSDYDLLCSAANVSNANKNINFLPFFFQVCAVLKVGLHPTSYHHVALHGLSIFLNTLLHHLNLKGV